MQEKARRKEALQRPEAAAGEVRARNRDLCAEGAEVLADRLVREAIEEMTPEGKVTFRKV